MLSIRTARRAAALVSVGAVTLAPLPTAALATSAGDQQYVDPLERFELHAVDPPQLGIELGLGSSSASSARELGPSLRLRLQRREWGHQRAAPTASTAAAGSTGSATGRTLPFTGYDGGLAVALGAGLVAGGVLLRRRVASTER